MKHIYNILFLVLLFWISCSKLDPGCSLPHGGTDALISFGVGELASFDVTTKATPVTSLSSFYASAATGSAGSETSVFNSLSFSDGDGDGSYTSNCYWPSTSTSYNFYASNVPLTFAGTGTTVSATNDIDVVCAYSPASTYKTKCELTFRHIFSQLGDVTVRGTGSNTVSGISVSLTPKTGGIYNLRTGTWSSVSTGSAISIASSTVGTQFNDVLLVPGEYTVSCSWTSDSSTHTNVVSEPFTFRAGRNVVLNIVLGPDATVTLEDIALPGLFSVAKDKKVRFARGNLQVVVDHSSSVYVGGGGFGTSYNLYYGDWQVAEHQYDVIGNNPGNNSLADGTIVDLFSWVGESATYDTYGLNDVEDVNDLFFGDSSTDDLKTDWGSIPDIVDKYEGTWRVLESTEWQVLLKSRTNALTKIGKATITLSSGSVSGIVLLPDSWSLPSNCSFQSGTYSVYPTTGAATNQYLRSSTSVFTDNTYSATAASGSSNAWVDMEDAGAVFLPCTGYRIGTIVQATSQGHYYSSTSSSDTDAYGIYFTNRNIYGAQNEYSMSRFRGCGVRLVCDAD